MRRRLSPQMPDRLRPDEDHRSPSDLHFGSIDLDVVEAMAAEVRTAEPSIVVVSGDLTQRARKQEFMQARSFLDALPSPRLVVPGNHDVPLFDLYARIFTP